MSRAMLYAETGMLLFSLGFYGLVVYAGMLRKALAINLMSSGVFIFLVAVAYRGSGIAPDPVPHALVLTGIVVAVSGTAFMLAVIYCIYAGAGSTLLDPAGEDDRKEQP